MYRYRPAERGVFCVDATETTSAEDFGFLVHELLHAVSETMRMIGVDFSEDSEEVYAYTIGWLAHQIMERFGITISSCRAQQP